MGFVMKSMPNAVVVGVAGLVAMALSVHAAEVPAKAGIGPSTFARLKSLAGEWRGTMETRDGPPVRATYRVTGAGSALVETLFPDTEHEMVTVYHLDKDALVLTHYCAAGNQPHMRLDGTASTAERLVFAFDGGTSFDPAVDMHMHSAVIKLVDPDHLDAEWALYQKGQPQSAHRFLLERVQTTAK
jgi:hypothetical protein